MVPGMLQKWLLVAVQFVAILAVSACSESREDPCRLLSVDEVVAIDSTVTTAMWAGRDGAQQDDEVCVYYAADGNPRVMLFVWYGSEKEPEDLVRSGGADTSATVLTLAEAGTAAAAAFGDGELKLLAVSSPQGTIGLRVRASVREDSAELDQVVRLARTALNRY